VAKVITYDAPSNTVFYDGGTEADAVECTDILAADVAGGWNVFGSLGTRCYWTTAKLHGGSNATTHFGMDGESLLIYTAVADNGAAMQTEGAGSWSFVRSAVVVQAPATAHHYINMAHTGALTIRLSTIMVLRGGGCPRISAASPCTISNSALMSTQGVGPNLPKDASVEYSLLSGGPSYPAASTGIEHNVMYGVLTCRADLTLSSPVIEGVGYAYVWHGDLTVTDPDGWWDTATRLRVTEAGYESAIELRWTFALTVHDEDGAAVEGAHVTVEDALGTTHAAYDTNASGQSPTAITLPEFRWVLSEIDLIDIPPDEPTTEYDYNPYTITVEWPDGVTMIVSDLTVDRRIECVIERPDVPATSDVRLGTSYADGSLEGVFVGTAHYLTGDVDVPTVTGTVVVPEISGSVG